MLASLFTMLAAFAQERTITGKITDAKSHLPLSSCSVFSSSTGNGVITDEKGNFSFTISSKTDSIVVSMVGYNNMIKPVSQENNQVINFQLNVSSSAMGEIVVSAKSKYTRAQRLIMRVIKTKPQNNIYESKSFQCKMYDKIELDIKNIPQRLLHSRLIKPFDFILKNIDTTDDGQTFLPVYLSESMSDYYLRKDPYKERYDYTALKMSGNSNQTVLKYVDGIYKGLNIYNDNLKLLKVNFISPIADDALSFYNYHISDTLFISNHRCIEVQFSRYIMAPMHLKDMFGSLIHPMRLNL